MALLSPALMKTKDQWLEKLIVWPTDKNTKTLQVIGKNGWYSESFTPEQLAYLHAHKDDDDAQYKLVDGSPERWILKISDRDARSAVNRELHKSLLTPENANARLIKMTGGTEAAKPAESALGARADTLPYVAPTASSSPAAAPAPPSDPAPAPAPPPSHVPDPTLAALNCGEAIRMKMDRRRPAIEGERDDDDWESDPDYTFKPHTVNRDIMADHLEEVAGREAAAAAAKPNKGLLGWAVDAVGNALGAKSFEPEDQDKKKVIAHKQKVVQALVKDNTELRKERGLPITPPPPPPPDKETQDEKIARLDKRIKDLTEENQELQKRPKITPPPPPAAAAARPASPAMAPAMAARAGVAPVAGGVGVVDPMDLQLLRERVQDLENELRDKNQYIRLREMDHNAAISIKDGALQSADVRQKFLENQVQDLTTQLQALQVQVANKDAQIQALQAPQPANVLETHRLKQQVAQQQADLAKANADIATLQAQLALPPPPSAEEARLQAELTLAKNEVTMLRAHPPSAPPAPASSEVARLQAEIARLKATPASAAPVDVENTPLYKDLLAAFQDVSQEALDYQAKVHKLEMEMRALQKSPGVPLPVSHDKQCAKLQDTIDDLNDKMTKLSLEKKILQQKVTELTNDKSDQTSVSESREERIRGLKAENARLAADYKELNKTYHALLKKHGERLGGLPKEVEQMYEQYKAAKSGPPPDRFRRY